MAVATTKPSRARLRRSDLTVPGLTRRRRGRGFTYLDCDGEPVRDEEVLARIQELAIPPAWKDVWICPYPGGHIQATGIDAAGRKQYLYHPRWRARRDQEKFDEMLDFARALPRMRERVERDLEDRDDLGRERVLACAVRLLDRGFFRIGSEDYAVTNETYGLATMRRDHVTVDATTVSFDYPAKHGKRRVQSVVDPEVAVVVQTLKRRRSGGDELLAYKRGRRWVDVKSADINAYVKEATGSDFSAKDFRTWGATVLAAVAVAVSGGAAETKTARRRAVVRAVKEVAFYLGNTPAVARASYIDPRVFDRYQDGLTIAGVLEELGAEPGDTAIQGPVEAAVIDLIEGHESAAIVRNGSVL
ncbi:MAG TPA: DNA topoisomerase IB [Capillimicrobium sp.]|nr:DNA topoisomerase IB [Capillimicrobium sp.]